MAPLYQRLCKLLQARTRLLVAAALLSMALKHLILMHYLLPLITISPKLQMSCKALSSQDISVELTADIIIVSCGMHGMHSPRWSTRMGSLLYTQDTHSSHITTGRQL